MSSELVIGVRWEEDFFESIAALNELHGPKTGIFIREIYGSLTNDPIGTAREWERLSSLWSYGVLEDWAKLARGKGITIAYTNNPACLGSSHERQERMRLFDAHLYILGEIGIRRMILSDPALIEFTKKERPEMKISVSSVSGVDSLEMAEAYATMGADTLIVPRHVNRDFGLLEQLCQVADIELIVNAGCLLFCPFERSHNSIQAHDSLEGSDRDQHYPYDRCWPKMAENWPANFLKAGWVRPEDLHVYEGIGIHKFKISGRTMPKAWILASAEHYMKREFDGNLLELVPVVAGKVEAEGTHPPLSVPNKQLGDFLDYFLQEHPDCRRDCGITCTYCETYAQGLRGHDANISGLPSSRK